MSQSVLPDPDDDDHNDDQFWWDSHVCQFPTEYYSLLSPSDYHELFNDDANVVETEEMIANDVETEEDPTIFSDDDDEKLVKIMKKPQPQSLSRNINSASLVILDKPKLYKSMSITWDGIRNVFYTKVQRREDVAAPYWSYAYHAPCRNYDTNYLAPRWVYVNLTDAAETCHSKFSATAALHSESQFFKDYGEDIHKTKYWETSFSDPGGGRGGPKGGDTTMVKNTGPSSENWDLREKWVTQHYD